MSAAKEFKEFVLRGNVVDLAVGVVIGAAFGKIVGSFVTDIITPLIGIPGKVDLSRYQFTIHGSTFLIGDFLNTVIAFLLVALAVFFFVVKPVNYLMSLHKTEPATEPVTRTCPECLSSIPIGAKRCAFCTAEVSPI